MDYKEQIKELEAQRQIHLENARQVQQAINDIIIYNNSEYKIGDEIKCKFRGGVTKAEITRITAEYGFIQYYGQPRLKSGKIGAEIRIYNHDIIK